VCVKEGNRDQRDTTWGTGRSAGLTGAEPGVGLARSSSETKKGGEWVQDSYGKGAVRLREEHRRGTTRRGVHREGGGEGIRRSEDS